MQRWMALAAALVISLQLGAPGWASVAWIRLDGRPVLELRSATGAQTPAEVAQRGSKRLLELAQDGSVQPPAFTVEDVPPYTMVGLRRTDGSFTALLGVDDRAGAAFGVSRQQLARRYSQQLGAAVASYRSSHSLSSWLRGTALALLVLGIYILWIRGQLSLHTRLRRTISHQPLEALEHLRLGANQPFTTRLVQRSLLVLLQGLHWFLLALASYLLIPLLLGFFPPTQVIAEGLRSQILNLVGGLLTAVVAAIPNLLAIAVILAFTLVAIRLSNAWFAALQRGSVRFHWFYSEWAQPTGRIAATLILLAGLVIAFPYVPGSGSKVFQGAGLFLGVLAALGSSAVATNVISGLMLIYTRAFQEGDRVDINGVVGVVQQRALLVTRIRTPRHELVSVPNASVISSSVVNFSFARREINQSVAVATTITIGYDVPWRTVHQLLLSAAETTTGIASEPEPFVLQTALNDYHISYELTACVEDVNRYRETLSALLGSIQDAFAEAKVEILSPMYNAVRDGNRSTVPPWS
jgi:small-conductance mechanosensitive channel